MNISRTWRYNKKDTGRVYSVYMETEVVEEANYDINPELSALQQQLILTTLKMHEKVFATFLKEVEELKAEPYVIKLKDGAVPVRITRRMVPYEANQWFKEYVDQL